MPDRQPLHPMFCGVSRLISVLACKSEAVDAYKLVFKTLEVEMCKDLLADADTKTRSALTTKTSGVLLAYYAEPPENLRARVQIELKQSLRGNGLHESTSLHPILLDRVQKTLKCQV
eukprot:6491060-Amphidinium_carterae.4